MAIELRENIIRWDEKDDDDNEPTAVRSGVYSRAAMLQQKVLVLAATGDLQVTVDPTQVGDGTSSYDAGSTHQCERLRIRRRKWIRGLNRSRKRL